MALFMVKTWMGNKATPIYGAEWAGTSDPSWTRTDDAVGFSAPNPYYAGMSTTPSSPFDNIMPWSGMRRVTDASAGELVEIPKFYYKLSQPNGVGLKIQISMSQFDGSYVDPMHMDRGDGVGEREHAYIGRYHCSSSNYKSATGVAPKAYITRATARTAIHNLGSNIFQCDFATRFTLWLLYIVEFANWNSQATIGYGGSGATNMGYTDSMPYHTGTDKTSRTTYGGTQYRYIEGLWDKIFDWIDGAYYNSSGLNIIINPNNFSDSTGGALMPLSNSFDGNPSAFTIYSESNAYPLFAPKSVVSQQYSLYMCDSWAYIKNNSNPCICGGGFTSDQYIGLFSSSSVESSLSVGHIGARLMVLPPSRLSA